MNGTSVAQTVAAANLRIGCVIEELAHRALRAIGHPGSAEMVAAARARMVRESPLYVRHVLLHGRVTADGAQGGQGGETPADRRYTLPHYCSLSRATEFAELLFRDYVAQSIGLGLGSGCFVPESMVLLDQFGNAVQEYAARPDWEGGRRHRWIDELPEQGAWTHVRESAQHLRGMAMQHAANDSHHAAAVANRTAASMETLVSAAVARPRLIA